VAVDANGIYVVGAFSNTVDFDPGPGTYNLVSVGGMDAYVAKLDPAGSLVSAKRFGGTESSGMASRDLVYSPHDGAFDVMVRDGAVIVVGHFMGTVDFDLGPGTYELPSAGREDVFTLRLAPDESRYYLVVPTSGSAEGSYGRNTSDVERPAATVSCKPQVLGDCVP
jgi:hypothetical protein